jgi:hypothetical protein
MVEGLPKEITLSTLNSFSHKYETTPDVIQLTTPNLDGNTEGYFAPKPELTKVGQRVEVDYFECEFNEETSEYKADKRLKVTKLPTHRGATSAFIAADVYDGWLNKPETKSIDNIKDLHKVYQTRKIKIEKLQQI